LGLEAKTPMATSHDQDPSPFLVFQWKDNALINILPFPRMLRTSIYLAYAGVERTLERVQVLLLDSADTEFHGHY
jgi:hypothetical protein